MQVFLCSLSDRLPIKHATMSPTEHLQSDRSRDPNSYDILKVFSKAILDKIYALVLAARTTCFTITSKAVPCRFGYGVMLYATGQCHILLEYGPRIRQSKPIHYLALLKVYNVHICVSTGIELSYRSPDIRKISQLTTIERSCSRDSLDLCKYARAAKPSLQ